MNEINATPKLAIDVEKILPILLKHLMILKNENAYLKNYGAIHSPYFGIPESNIGVNTFGDDILKNNIGTNNFTELIVKNDIGANSFADGIVEKDIGSNKSLDDKIKTTLVQIILLVTK